MDTPAAEPLSIHHERIRRRGIHRPVYLLVRLLLEPAIRIWFRLARTGHEHVPSTGPLILAANHRSFLDPFAIGSAIRRPVYFVAKRELFQNRLVGWLLNCLGAFPIRRGASDEEAMETARILLERGDAVVIFPEGTRIREGSLGRPRRGVGRLALETGAPVVPVAITGSEHARRGALIRPVKVALRYGRPLTYPRVAHPSPHLAGEVTARIWPCVELQWEWLGGLPPLRRAAVVGAGSMGSALAVLLSRAGLEVELGCRTSGQAARIAAAGCNEEYLPGVALPPQLRVTTAAELDLARADLVVLAVPARALPQAVAKIADRVGPQTHLLVVSKGLVAPLGRLPSEYAAERMGAGSVACLAGPAHAREAVERSAAVVVASEDPHLARRLSDVLARAGLDVSRTDDVTGAALAGCGKNAAALAAAAAARTGANLAGAMAGRVFAEVHQLALARRARPETFAGLAGSGDLVATVLAEGSRNRRAGEMLAAGMAPHEVAMSLGQAVEALDAVPLLAAQAGRDAPALAALAGLIEGRVSPEQWAATSARRAA